MDWFIVECGWEVYVYVNVRCFLSVRKVIEVFCDEMLGISDQFFLFFVVDSGSFIEDGDGVVFFNFCGDRVIEIMWVFIEDGLFFFDWG